MNQNVFNVAIQGSIQGSFENSMLFDDGKLHALLLFSFVYTVVKDKEHTIQAAVRILSEPRTHSQRVNIHIGVVDSRPYNRGNTDAD